MRNADADGSMTSKQKRILYELERAVSHRETRAHEAVSYDAQPPLVSTVWPEAGRGINLPARGEGAYAANMPS